MLQRVLDWDTTVWYTINNRWANDVFDLLMPYLRNQWFWAPLYLFLLIFMPANHRRTGWLWCLFFLATFALTDFISASLLKPHFQRIRPCNEGMLIDIVRTLVPCGSGYSFPSSHAANHFGMGVFAAATMGKRYRMMWFLWLLWAFAISYAQVYVGVHYPLDVLAGGILGATIGLLMSGLFNLRFKLQRTAEAPTVVQP